MIDRQSLTRFATAPMEPIKTIFSYILHGTAQIYPSGRFATAA